VQAIRRYTEEHVYFQWRFIVYYIPDSYLEQLILEDIPYFDLTTHLLGIEGEPARIRYLTREDCMLCGSEEVARIFEKLGARVEEARPSGSLLKAGDSFFEASGPAGVLHAGWKVGLNIFDHCSAIATKAQRMVTRAHEVAARLPILTTRKSMPSTKPLMTKAVICGGAIPHRLGLSETVLIFENHTAFIGGLDGLLERLELVLAESCEKKVFVEAGADDARRLAQTGIDGIQLDKLSPAELATLVPELRVLNPRLTLIAAGGINESNVQDYAATGVDGLATTALFTAKPLDMTAHIRPLP
jgi:molybdenum transport protein